MSEIGEALNGRCDQERLLRGIRDLLGLYWQPSDTAEERARQAMLFVRDLAEFSNDVVQSALRSWRRTQDRRPSIAALRQLCMVRRAELTSEIDRRRPAPVAGPSPLDLSPDEKARRKATFDRVAVASAMCRDRETGQWTLPPRHGSAAEDEPERPFEHWTSRVAPAFAADQLRRARLKAGTITQEGSK